MNARVVTATRLGLREQFRRPLLLVLLVVLPFFFITRAIAATEPMPRTIGLPGGAEVATNMRDVHGALMATITIAFLSGLCGAFTMRSARSGDRRLVVAGFRPIEAVAPRLAILGAASGVVLAVSLLVTALSFTPHDWILFVVGNLLVALTYACLGALAATRLGDLGATYAVLFVAMLGTGILQNPMFGDGTPDGLALVMPDYAAARIVVAGGFADGFAEWALLGAALVWILVLGSLTAWRLRSSLRLR